MITINVRLNLPAVNVEKGTVTTVYFKNRTNIIGTCSIDQDENGTTGVFTIAEELHDNLYVLYLYGAIQNEVVLDGILLDDSTHNKAFNTVSSVKIA
jgi:hypothetical protein